MVKFQKQIETLYDATCEITHKEEYTDENGVTFFNDVILASSVPCRVSSQNAGVAINDGKTTYATKEICLYTKPDINIPVGSVIVVTFNEHVVEYESASKPAMYDSYQRVNLNIRRVWV